MEDNNGLDDMFVENAHSFIRSKIIARVVFAVILFVLKMHETKSIVSILLMSEDKTYRIFVSIKTSFDKSIAILDRLITEV